MLFFAKFVFFSFSNLSMYFYFPGSPPPRVSWWREHALLDDSFQVLPDGTVKNILHLSKISRRDLHTVKYLIFCSFLSFFYLI